MRETGVDLPKIKEMFTNREGGPFEILEMSESSVSVLLSDSAIPFRRCYIADELLKERMSASNCAAKDILDVVLPDPGSTMSGDFGEVLTAFYLAATSSSEAFDSKKWRLKADRTKSAPYSDVVQFILPHWPESSDSDRINCAEVKTKATKSNSSPIASAIEDSKKDSDTRLIKTLNWLRERALMGVLSPDYEAQLDRFIYAIGHAPFERCFYAVAVISADLVDKEIAAWEGESPADRKLMVISIPGLKSVYEAVYEGIRVSGDETKDD